MKISAISLNNKILKYTAPLLTAGLFAVSASAQNTNKIPERDEFISPLKQTYKSIKPWSYSLVNDSSQIQFSPINPLNKITPKGLTTEEFPHFPSPIYKIGENEIKLQVIVDLRNNVLYSYDTNGNPQKVYKIASGKKSTPTYPGLRMVSHKEHYPYKNVPETTKRRKNPRDYGPKLLYLVTVDPNTGEIKGSNGQFIHGTSNPSSIGKYVSHGCIRMDNDAIQEIDALVDKGAYVLIKD